MLSISDELYTVLGEAGYTGTANDRVYKWLQDTVGRTDLSINDMAMLLFKRIGYTGSISDIVNSKVPVPLTLLAQGLFINGEQGCLYDLYDQSTLFQDAAGTIPWTTLGQPLGLQLDKSKGLVLGSELVSNPGGPFTSTTGWTADSSSLSVSGGSLVITNTSGGTYGKARATITTVAGQWYKIRIGSAAGTASFWVGSSLGGSQLLATAVTAGASRDAFFLAAGTTTYIQFLAPSTTLGDFCSISACNVRSIAGNHRYQTTSASRPTIEARVNLFTKSEFPGGITDSAVRGGLITGASLPNWLGRFTTGIAFGHDGLTTSYIYMGSAVASAQHTFSVFVKMDDGNAPSFGSATAANVANDFVLIVSGLIASPLTYAVTSVGDGVYRVSATVTAGTANLGHNGAGKYNTNSSRTFKVTGYQLELGSVATTYQRVTTATDYADIGAPRRIKYDGIDDFLQTASVDFSATDKMTVWAGVRKLSDAAAACVCELSANVGSNNGAFSLFAPASAAANIQFSSKGTTQSSATVASGVASPVSMVVCGIGNITPPSVATRINGAVAASNTFSQGTGNYGNYPIYFGARAGTSNRFSGEVFSPEVIRGAESTAAQIDMVERVINRNMGGVY